ncbi:MAG: uracil-DNA glycosylase, partial [Thermoplasmata archaeon]
DSFARLREEIVGCRACPRLVKFRERIARERKREFRDEEYWGRPVPGFGDPAGRLIIVGLAPAPHGGNRTGRVFTGDRSAAFLVRALHATGFASQPTSQGARDGLRYTDAYVSAAVRCAPPDNRPSPVERDRCRPFLGRELALLSNARAYLALGGFAWDGLRAEASAQFGLGRITVPFAHGACAPLGPGRPILWGSYHPSPLNTNTGKLTFGMMVDLIGRIRAGYEGSTGPAPDGARR